MWMQMQEKEGMGYLEGENLSFQPHKSDSSITHSSQCLAKMCLSHSKTLTICLFKSYRKNGMIFYSKIEQCTKRPKWVVLLRMWLAGNTVRLGQNESMKFWENWYDRVQMVKYWFFCVFQLFGFGPCWHGLKMLLTQIPRGLISAQNMQSAHSAWKSI